MDNLEKIANMFEKFLALYKFVNKKTIIDALQTELNSNQLIEIYRLTDGEHSTRDIAGQISKKCTHATIEKLWKQWAHKGLVVATTRQWRVKAAFNLNEYGIVKIQEE